MNLENMKSAFELARNLDLAIEDFDRFNKFINDDREDLLRIGDGNGFAVNVCKPSADDAIAILLSKQLADKVAFIKAKLAELGVDVSAVRER